MRVERGPLARREGLVLLGDDRSVRRLIQDLQVNRLLMRQGTVLFRYDLVLSEPLPASNLGHVVLSWPVFIGNSFVDFDFSGFFAAGLRGLFFLGLYGDVLQIAGGGSGSIEVFTPGRSAFRI